MPIKLQAIDGPAKGKVFEFKEHETFVFGRDAKAHCRIENDPAVSRHHFMLEVNPPLARVQDLGSTNGTVVNGRKLGGKNTGPSSDSAVVRGRTTDLHDGDQIKVGKTLFVVKVDALTPDETDTLAGPGPETPLVDPARTPSVPQPRRGLADMVASAKQGEDPEVRPQVPGFTILNLLGRGGMGAVFLAERKATSEKVAIKTMLPRTAVKPQAQQLFRREIAATRTLAHPHIVRFYEDGYAGGMFYLVIEYLSGGDLEALMTREGGKVAPAVVVPLMLQALEGLCYAHGKGYVHRDLKPQNILLAPANGGGQVAKISDLGLAKSFEKAGWSGFTATGAQGGTLGYMPPEQVMDFKRVTPAADVFSMGATLYQVLSGEYVYNFRSGVDKLSTILGAEITPIGRRMPGLPKPLAQIIDKAVSPEPVDRFPNAGAMRDALKAVSC